LQFGSDEKRGTKGGARKGIEGRNALERGAITRKGPKNFSFAKIWLMIDTVWTVFPVASSQ